jgi:hypothetical protein
MFEPVLIFLFHTAGVGSVELTFSELMQAAITARERSSSNAMPNMRAQTTHEVHGTQTCMSLRDAGNIRSFQL